MSVSSDTPRFEKEAEDESADLEPRLVNLMSSHFGCSRTVRSRAPSKDMASHPGGGHIRLSVRCLYCPRTVHLAKLGRITGRSACVRKRVLRVPARKQGKD